MMHRAIKSFVMRAGRVSPRQQAGLDRWLANYIMPAPDHVWDLEALFGRQCETIVEIGFGMGASLVTMAKENPHINFIGIEVHRAGIGSLASDLHDEVISNVRIAPYDAVEVFSSCFSDDSLAGVQIFFPDPWPKKRHHKRRLVQADFIRGVCLKIQPGGFIHCATDWHDYAEQMLDVLQAESLLQNKQKAGGFVPRPSSRPMTKFEKRGERLGHSVWDLMFIRKDIS